MRPTTAFKAPERRPASPIVPYRARKALRRGCQRWSDEPLRTYEFLPPVHLPIMLSLVHLRVPSLLPMAHRVAPVYALRCRRHKQYRR